MEIFLYIGACIYLLTMIIMLAIFLFAVHYFIIGKDAYVFLKYPFFKRGFLFKTTNRHNDADVKVSIWAKP